MKEILEIKKIVGMDALRNLIAVFSAAFECEYKVKEDYLQYMLLNDSVVILGVVLDDNIVGGLVAFEMMPIHGSKEFYIYDIAIHPDQQKKGFGEKLIVELKREAKARDVETIFVEAESEDTGAVAFYRAIGGEEVAVNHFNFTV